MSHISLHTAARHETRRQTAVGDALRKSGHRFWAAVELEQAAEQVRLAAGAVTQTQKDRLAAAQTAWDNRAGTNRRVTT